MLRAIAIVLPLLASCNIGPVNWPATVQCVGDSAAGLLGDVTTVLGSSTGPITRHDKSLMGELAKVAGVNAVLCAVKTLAMGLVPGVHRESGSGVHVRAQAFLDEVGTR